MKEAAREDRRLDLLERQAERAATSTGTDGAREVLP
jgi:hypothetical protein